LINSKVACINWPKFPPVQFFCESTKLACEEKWENMFCKTALNTTNQTISFPMFHQLLIFLFLDFFAWDGKSIFDRFAGAFCFFLCCLEGVGFALSTLPLEAESLAEDFVFDFFRRDFFLDKSVGRFCLLLWGLLGSGFGLSSSSEEESSNDSSSSELSMRSSTTSSSEASSSWCSAFLFFFFFSFLEGLAL